MELWDQAGWAGWQAMALCMVARALYRLGDVSASRRQLERATALWRGTGAPDGIGWAAWVMGNMALDAGDTARAGPLLADSLRLAYQVGNNDTIARGLEGLARLTAMQGQPDLALRLAGAGALLRELEQAPIERDLGRWAYEWLPRVRQRMSARSAAAAWADGQSMPLHAAVDLALRIVGPHRALSAGHQHNERAALTAREFEVAALIAQGRTDRQIAAALVISVRTAHAYVRTILQKLDLHGRVAIASWFIRSGNSGPTVHPRAPLEQIAGASR